MKGIKLIIYVCLVTSAYGHGLKLIFEDKFEKLDKDKWDHEVTMWGGGNKEFQTYSTDPANTYVRDNTLYIKPSLTKDNINPLTAKPFGEAFLYNGTWNLTEMYGKCTMDLEFGCFREGKYRILPPTMSGRLRTKGRFSFRFGRLEVVAKMPVGDWMWPAIWMLPEDDVYGGWPRSGEIDMVESRGNRDLRNNKGLIGIQRIGSALHWGPVWNVNKFPLTVSFKTNESHNYGDYYHKYEMDWDGAGLRFSVDGEEYARFPDPLINENANWTGFWDYGKQDGGLENHTNPWENGTLMSPFDQKFHLVVNVAVGGINPYFPDGIINNGNETKPWNNSGPGDGMQQFWDAYQQWAPTWEGENAALQIKSVRVYQFDTHHPDPPKTTTDSSDTSASHPEPTPDHTAIILVAITALFVGNLLYIKSK